MSSTNKGYLVVVIAALASLVLVATATTQSYAQNEKYRAKLDGNNEVPAVNTTAEGVINFKTKNDMLTWTMNVTGANDPTGINIHNGKAGEKGEIVVDLMKVSKHSDSPKGMTMRGNVTESSLMGSMAGKTIADLKTAIANGDVYVNLKTQDHPDGLMRGQIKLKGDNATSSVNATSSTNSAS
ncbi:MAG: CHRD domain-containing protein [Nitrososphaeraceae archaeon]